MADYGQGAPWEDDQGLEQPIPPAAEGLMLKRGGGTSLFGSTAWRIRHVKVEAYTLRWWKSKAAADAGRPSRKRAEIRLPDFMLSMADEPDEDGRYILRLAARAGVSLPRNLREYYTFATSTQEDQHGWGVILNMHGCEFEDGRVMPLPEELLASLGNGSDDDGPKAEATAATSDEEGLGEQLPDEEGAAEEPEEVNEEQGEGDEQLQVGLGADGGHDEHPAPAEAGTDAEGASTSNEAGVEGDDNDEEGVQEGEAAPEDLAAVELAMGLAGELAAADDTPADATPAGAEAHAEAEGEEGAIDVHSQEVGFEEAENEGPGAMAEQEPPVEAGAQDEGTASSDEAALQPPGPPMPQQDGASSGSIPPPPPSGALEAPPPPPGTSAPPAPGATEEE